MVRACSRQTVRARAGAHSEGPCTARVDATEKELKELSVVRVGVREHMRRAVEFFNEHVRPINLCRSGVQCYLKGEKGEARQ